MTAGNDWFEGGPPTTVATCATWIIGGKAWDDQVLDFAARLPQGSDGFQKLLAACQAAKVNKQDWRSAVAKRRPLHVAGPEDAPVHDPARPPILIKPGRLDLAVSSAIDALSKAPTLHLYVRKGEGDLVRISEAPKPDPEDTRAVFSEGTPRIFDLSLAGIATRLCSVASFQEAKGAKIVDVNPPHLLCAAVLDKGACVGRLHTLTGIIETPTMRPDGSILATPGYDPATGYYLALDGEWPEVPAEPTQGDACFALSRLADIFVDFPWQDPSGASVAIAATMAIVARPAIAGPIPAFIFDANEPGFGKSYIVDTICHLTTGRSVGNVHFPSRTDNSDEEVEKILAGAALGGARILWWDDLPFQNPFGGSALQGKLTARDTAQFRMLGQTKQMVLPWFAVQFGTGNNVQTTHDMERRSYRARIVSKWENSAARPEGKAGGWTHPERKGKLVEYVLEQRRALVVDVLTILRAFHLAGRPGTDPDHEGFEGFSRLVGRAIAWAGGEPIAKQRLSSVGRKSDERHALETVCAYWRHLGRAMSIKTGKIKLGAAISYLYPREGNGRIAQRPSDEFDGLREALETLDKRHKSGNDPDKQAIGLAFTKRETAVFVVDEYDGSAGGGKGVSRCLVADRSGRGGAAWQVLDPSEVPPDSAPPARSGAT